MNDISKQLRAQFYKGNYVWFSIALFSSLAAGSLNLILSWIIKQLIDTISNVNTSVTLKNMAEISILFVLLCIFLGLLDYIAQPRYLKRAITQYKNFAFKKLTEKNISSFKDENCATYISTLSNDINNIETNYLSQQLTMITKIITFIGAIAMMLYYSPLLTLITAIITTLPLIASILTGNRLQVIEGKVSDKYKEYTSALADCLNGFTVVKSFKAEKEVANLFERDNKQLEDEKYKCRRIESMIHLIGSTTGIVAQLGVFLIGTYLSTNNQSLTGGTVILFVNLMNFVIDPIAQLPGLLSQRKASLALIDKLADSLNKNSEVSGDKVITQLDEGIKLDDVSFGYESNKDVLHNISFNFEKGKSYAIVGSSGSGKSTLLNLLTGINSNYYGRIMFDNIEMKEISPKSLYDIVGLIQQNVFVFNASIIDNITMFRDFSTEDVDDAIKKSRLNELIETKTKQYLCGENGKNLSGGEKQRISVARSLLKNSSVLLADEITSALDKDTAYHVTKDILSLKGITRIIVTHALDEEVLKDFDKIIVMKNGTIVEADSFDNLMNEKGYFSALYTVSQ